MNAGGPFMFSFSHSSNSRFLATFSDLSFSNLQHGTSIRGSSLRSLQFSKIFDNKFSRFFFPNHTEISSPPKHSKSSCLHFSQKRSTSNIFDVFTYEPPAKRAFRFRTAASGLPKDFPYHLLKNRVTASLQAGIINDDRFKSFGCGEDSYFNRSDSIGVADGVGGWSQVKGETRSFKNG